MAFACRWNIDSPSEWPLPSPRWKKWSLREPPRVEIGTSQPGTGQRQSSLATCPDRVGLALAEEHRLAGRPVQGPDLRHLLAEKGALTASEPWRPETDGSSALVLTELSHCRARRPVTPVGLELYRALRVRPTTRLDGNATT
jgi:hypothetical protein